ncbi:hypothetical protein, partial [Mycobacterium tuberculosis]
ARSRSSGGYLLDEPPDMTPSFPRTGVSGHAGAVQVTSRYAKAYVQALKKSRGRIFDQVVDLTG